MFCMTDHLCLTLAELCASCTGTDSILRSLYAYQGARCSDVLHTGPHLA